MSRWTVVACALAFVGVQMAWADEDESPRRSEIQLLMPQESAARTKSNGARRTDGARFRRRTAAQGRRLPRRSTSRRNPNCRQGLGRGKRRPRHADPLPSPRRFAACGPALAVGPAGRRPRDSRPTLLLTTAAEADGLLVIKAYSVGDLLEPRIDQPDWPDFSPLINAIEFVDPVSWEPVGGPGNTMGLGLAQTLAVAQTDRAHVAIAALVGACGEPATSSSGRNRIGGRSRSWLRSRSRPGRGSVGH